MEIYLCMFTDAIIYSNQTISIEIMIKYIFPMYKHTYINSVMCVYCIPVSSKYTLC